MQTNMDGEWAGLFKNEIEKHLIVPDLAITQRK